MKKLTVVAAVALGALLLGLAWWRTHSGRPVPPAGAGAGAVAPVPAGGNPGSPGAPRLLPVRAPRADALSAAEKIAWAEQIKRDYDEIRKKVSADYTAAGTNFPGGLQAFLRQLALLEKEKHVDLAALLDPKELEDLEMRETTSGQLVQRLLGETAASEEQRRRVFRLQYEFDDRFALTFDISPPALLEREAARQALQEKICEVMGNDFFVSWLKGEGETFTQLTAFTEKQGLPAGAALDVWRAKNEFTLRRLELSARRDLTNEQLRAAQTQVRVNTEARLMAILGPGALTVAYHEVLGWLPRK